MKKIIPVDVSRFTFNINNNQSISTAEIKPGPPDPVEGFNVGIVTMEQDPPHGGEIHFDGDEILYVISGAISVTSDSNPGQELRLETGDSCIIEKNEWHKVHVIEEAQLIYVTPGSHSEHRPQEKA